MSLVIPRRLRFLGFRRISTPLIAILLLLLVVLLLITIFPSQLENSEHERSHHQNERKKAHLKVIDDLANEVNDGNQVMKPRVEAFTDTQAVAIYKQDIIGNFEPKPDDNSIGDRPGDNGHKYDLQGEGIDWNEVNAKKNEYGMNIVASEHIPMDRKVPDLRHEECKYWHYPKQLPTASVVIVFHNEGFSTLLRTVHSVLLRSPRKFLREVLLVDDYSDKEPLKAPLDDYIMEHFGPFERNWKEPDKDPYGFESLKERSGKVRLVREKERSGLIRSRARGAEEGLGEVIVFLDAHCEVNANWLVPLLAPIARDPKTMTVPIIDGIDSNHFEYRPVYARNDQHYRGIWEWGMLYKEIELDMHLHTKTHRVSEPYDSPTHAGGLFAISKTFFLDLGGYDPGLLVWGGENFELSFKVWQCGGRLLWVPCSRVGHIYRPFMPYNFGSMANQRKGPLVLTNYKRVIEVWFDQQYKDYFYAREPMAKFYDAGDISKQLELKTRLECKSFDWFVKHHAMDVFRNFPRLPLNVHWGEVRHGRTGTCLDSGGSQPPSTVSLSHCHGHGGNQLFRLNGKGQLGLGERCIDANRDKMTLIYCKLGTVDGPWNYDDKTSQLKYTPKGLCLTFEAEQGKVHLSDCNNGDESQEWTWRQIKPRV